MADGQRAFTSQNLVSADHREDENICACGTLTCAQHNILWVRWTTLCTGVKP